MLVQVGTSSGIRINRVNYTVLSIFVGVPYWHDRRVLIYLVSRSYLFVIPVKTGIYSSPLMGILDSCLRRNGHGAHTSPSFRTDGDPFLPSWIPAFGDLCTTTVSSRREYDSRQSGGSRNPGHYEALTYGGGDGIRTHEPVRVSGFQDRRHRPLGHPSWNQVQLCNVSLASHPAVATHRRQERRCLCQGPTQLRTAPQPTLP